MDGGWVCDECRSINRSGTDRCYSCHAVRTESQPVARRIDPPPDAPAGTAAWVVGPSATPQAVMEAVQRAAAAEMASFDPASVAAWQALGPDGQMWAAGSFTVVALGVALADGRLEPGELERSYLAIDRIGATTRSYVVNWALGILGDRELQTRVSETILSSPTAEPAFVAARAALGRLPEPDRARMTVALYEMAWSAITEKNGTPPTAGTIELQHLVGIIARLGLDLEASIAWVNENGR